MDTATSNQAADANLGVGAKYYVQKEEFEKVITSHFKIDSNTLRRKTRSFSYTFLLRPDIHVRKYG